MNRLPRIFVDADSCPVQIREIIVKASDRTGIESIFIANRNIPFSSSSKSRMVIIGKQDTSADEIILRECGKTDLVITRDIPLAAKLLEKGCIVLNDRGDKFSSDTIGERLSIRNTMKDFREAGLLPPGKKNFGKREIHAFSSTFDREITALLRLYQGDWAE